jgi:hypothetical protein
MIRMSLKICLVIAALFGSVSSVFARDLPPCPSSGYKQNCFGTYTSANGDKYVGEYKDGKMDGQGTYTWANGDKYVGEWKDGKQNGQGTATFANGEKYVGEYKDGKRNGQGTHTYTSGTAQEGIWKDNEFLNAQKKSELDEHKDFCTEIGLTPKTEKFGDCVLKLMDEARRRQRTLKN